MNIMLFGAGGSIGQALYNWLDSLGHEVYGISPEGPESKVRYGEAYQSTNQMSIQHDEELIEEDFGQFCDVHLAPPDIVICNIGATHIDPLEDYGIERFNSVMYLNCVIPFAIARHYTLLWRERTRIARSTFPEGVEMPRGRVVFTCSMAADRPMRQCYAYPASKAAEVMLVRTFAREFSGPDGIDYFGVSPCSIEGTNLIAYSDKRVQELRGWSKEQAENYTRASYPIGRLGDMQELLDIFEFACFKAPAAMSGSIIQMSAGGN